MSRNTIDNRIIENFLETSALYLGVNVSEEAVNNESPVTASMPKSFLIEQAGRMPRHNLWGERVL